MKGNGRRASVARFPSGRRQPARGFSRGLTGGLHRLPWYHLFLLP